ncbi:MAG TPA: DUF1440 domain-containing protein [Terriglobales bacterium]|nr:DUF1440 domain-containing protein [Terriglobales bacterium]
MHIRAEAWKGFVAGAAGGLAAAFVMDQFQHAWSKASQAMHNGHKKQRPQQEPQKQPPEPDATMRAAEKISEKVLKHPLSIEQQKKTGPWIHYAFGAIMGGLYGVATEYVPQVKSGSGLAFGAVLFVGADEIAVPAFRLSKPAWKAPLSSHVYGLASHFVYGTTAERVRREVRRALA